jgi:hypothetical protein
LFRRRVTIGHADIAAPYDLGFELRHYVLAPELREAEKLVEIVRLASGGLAKVDVASSATSAALYRLGDPDRERSLPLSR